MKDFDATLASRKLANWLLGFGPLVIVIATALLTVPSITTHPKATTIIGGVIAVATALVLWARKNSQSAEDIAAEAKTK